MFKQPGAGILGTTLEFYLPHIHIREGMRTPRRRARCPSTKAWQSSGCEKYKGVAGWQGNNCSFKARAVFCRTSEEAWFTVLGRVEEISPKEMAFDLSLKVQRREGISGTGYIVYKHGKDHSKFREWEAMQGYWNIEDKVNRGWKSWLEPVCAKWPVPS